MLSTLVERLSEAFFFFFLKNEGPYTCLNMIVIIQKRRDGLLFICCHNNATFYKPHQNSLAQSN